MKLMVQIPCYNEAGTLPEVLRDIPKSIEGISVIEVLIIDDGSTDETIKIASDFSSVLIDGLNTEVLGALSEPVTSALDGELVDELKLPGKNCGG